MTEKPQTENHLPEKARLLTRLKEGKFSVPDFIFVPAEDFVEENFKALEEFLEYHRESFKVIARSAHPCEEYYKGGTFDSLETYADSAGIIYARKKMMTSATTARRLTILRQQKFNKAPVFDLNDMGVIVMPFIEGTSVMAKMVADHWEFGYCRDRIGRVSSEPYITNTPHDRKLLKLSENIQKYLGFMCEIEYIVSEDGDIHIVQAKDISSIETLEIKDSERTIHLDGVRRIRKRRNYRERVIYVMDNQAFYMSIIDKCENFVHGWGEQKLGFEDILEIVTSYEAELEEFALTHQRFAILGLSIQVPEELYQIANHYLDDTPDLQKRLSKALYNNLYAKEYFLSEADTLIAKDKIRINLCSHDAYGIDTVRNPLWSVYWYVDRHESILREFKRVGFKTGDSVAIEIDPEEKPTLYRL